MTDGHAVSQAGESIPKAVREPRMSVRAANSHKLSAHPLEKRGAKSGEFFLQTSLNNLVSFTLRSKTVNLESRNEKNYQTMLLDAL